MPPRARLLSDHDRETWARYARHVKTLAGRPSPLPEPAPPPPRTKENPALPPPPTRTPIQPPSPLTTGVQPPGLDKATWKRLSGGRLPPARSLDLHGKTAHAAFQALQQFLLNAHADQLRCVEIITGRGAGEHGGILRRELPLWLNLPMLRPLILATTHPHKVNPGSTLVLLRRRKIAHG